MSNSDEGFKVRVQALGIKMSGIVPQEVGHQIMKLMLEAPMTPLSEENATEDFNDDEGTNGSSGNSVAQVETAEYVTVAEFILSIANFMRHQTGRNSITREQILAAYDNAKIKRPGNINRDIQVAVKKGWLEPIGRIGKSDSSSRAVKAWRIASEGDKAIQEERDFLNKDKELHRR